MFRKLRPANSGASRSNPDPSRVKKQRVTEGVKILLDIAKESSDWFPPLAAVLGGVNTLIRHHEEFKDVGEKIKGLKPQLDRLRQAITTTTIDGDPEETARRVELTSSLEDIERHARQLLTKGPAARFVDKAGDSGEVVRLVERLQEAIVYYQVSQQQAIYDRITDLASSFGTLLKHHNVSPVTKNKLESVIARLARLCSEDDDDALHDENEHELREKLFNTLSQIGDNGNAVYGRMISQGYEECQDDIIAVSGLVEDIRDALLDYQMAQQRVIYDQNCRLIDAADLSVLNNCRRAPGAGYQHGDRKGCLRGTREAVLDEIESWTKDSNESPIFWLNGLAGTGKSMIAQTVSERVFADGLLGASFFCSRDFKDRSDLHFIFPTLAFQLAHKYLEFRSILVPLLQSNPDVVHESLYGQMRKLIVEPLTSADISAVIVIDALDECADDEPQSAILSVLGRLVEEIPKVKFFITGRPEPRIKSGFRLPLLKTLTNVFILHDVQPASIDNDIKLFLKHELSELARRHLLIGWPTDENIDLLCQRAAGLFVHAVATVKFLDKRFYLPDKQLQSIIDSPHATDYEGRTSLDSLYLWILGETFCVDDPVIHSKVRSTIGAVVLLVNPLPPSGVAELVGLETREVLPFLASVQSLLILDEDPTKPVKPFHKSFPDFITDPSRCTDTRFYISPKDRHLELATNCLRLVNSKLERNLLSLPDYALNSEVKDLQTRVNNRVSVALQYACQFWHNHLIMARGDVTDVLSHLCLFLEEKFLVWLEVISVLGAARRAVCALEQLASWLQEVVEDEKLLNTAKDCVYFVTRFFEPINISATHIYHSALELSPLSSIIRKLYYHHRHTPLPRAAVGIPDSWYPSIAISSTSYSSESSTAWSPCGRFIATQTEGAVEIRDPLTFEPLSTLQPTELTSQLVGALAYSPDQRSLACASNTALVIWDIQSGGVAQEIKYNDLYNDSLVWSLDGRVISTMYWSDRTERLTVCRYDVASGTVLSPVTLWSRDKPHIWTHGRSFRVMTTTRDKKACTVDIFEVGPALTRTESFVICSLRGYGNRISCFSPTTYRVSVSVDGKGGQLLILDVRDSTRLLHKEGAFSSHSFSSDGCLFATSQWEGVRLHIWKYENGRYAPWRQFPFWCHSNPHFLFSPTSSSILAHSCDTFRLWRLDGSSIALVTHPQQLGVFSPSGNYIANVRKGGHTVTITNPLSRSSRFIDTDVAVLGLGLTGNVLLVVGPEVVVAWLLTEEGVVNRVCGNRRAGRSDSIWTVPTPRRNPEDPQFLVKGGTGAIRSDGTVLHVYNTRTGEVLEPAQTPQHLDGPSYSLLDITKARNHLYDSPMDDAPPRDDWEPSPAGLKEGWMMDCGGKHLLWLPAEWRTGDYNKMKWFPDIATIQLESVDLEPVIIKLY